MKIKSIKSYKRDLILKKPYTIAYKTISKVENVFLEVELENGIIGYGAANPDLQVVGEGPDDTLINCQSNFFMSLIGKDIRNFQNLIFECNIAFPNLAGTIAILDIALHDAFCKYLGIAVVDFYGRKHNSLPTSVTIGIMNVDESIREAKEFAKLGFKVVKVKTGQSENLDSERVIKIHENSPGLKIRVDANQGYNEQQLSNFIHQTKDINLELIEQPVKVGNENVLAKFEDKYRKKFAADESLKNAKSAIEFAGSPQLFGIYNIKFMKCGGVIGAKEIATIANTSGIELFWGCNDESIISISAALHTALSCPNTKYLDLDGSLDLAEDLVNGGFIIEDGYMQTLDKPGFGFEYLK